MSWPGPPAPVPTREPYTGSADQAGGAADQREGPVPGELKPPHGQELDQVPEVEARCRRIESAVEHGGIPREERLEFGFVGGHLHEAAPTQLLPDV